MKKFTLPTTFQERMTAVSPILEFSFLKRIGEITEKIPPDEPFERILNRIFADLVLDLLKPSLRRKRKKIPEKEVEQLIKNAMPEIERIYSAIRSVGFSGYSNVGEDDWQAAALGEYDKDRGNFTFIKRNYLEDRKFFSFRDGQERGDFIGGILQKIVEDRLEINIGAQLLTQMSRKINRLK